MPDPTRPSRTATVAPTSTSTTVEAEGTESSSTPRGATRGARARPVDIYNRKPAKLRKELPLGQAAELGTFNGSRVVVGTDGVLGLGAAPTSLSEQIRAAKLAVIHAPETQPFSSVTDVRVLRSAAVAGAALFDACLKTPANDGEALELRAGRAAAFGVMEAAARRAGALGDTEARDDLTLGLLFSVGKEPYRPLRDFAYESTLSRAAANEIPKIKTAESALYPRKPPYEKWLKDGKISIVHYCDDAGSPRVGNIELYTARGFTRTDLPDGTTVLTRPASGRKPAVEVKIPPSGDYSNPPALFEHMGNPDVDTIIYAGHAGYGRRVEDALAKGVKGTGDGKLVVLLQCWGEGSIESINRAFPDSHLVSTTEMSDDNYDFTLVDHMLQGFDKRESYEEIARHNNQEFTDWVNQLTPGTEPDEITQADIDYYKQHPVDRHFFYPNSREVILRKLDRDRDGIHDDADTMFNIVYPKRVDASGGYDPLDPGVPIDGLDGSAANQAINQLNLVARYAQLPQGLLGDLPWHPEVFENAGFFEGDSSDLRAFKFEVDRTANKIRVQVNSQFAHAPASALGRMLAIEAGHFAGLQAQLDEEKKAALSLSFLERIHHQAGQPVTGAQPLENTAFQDGLLRQRYGHSLTIERLLAVSQNPDDFMPESFDRILAEVRATPDLRNLGAARPQRATAALEIPAQLSLPPSYLDTEALQALMTRLGVTGEVDRAAHPWAAWVRHGEPLTVAMLENGARFYVSLGVDSEGVVRTASRIGENGARA